jgi:hypothetical protein
MMSTRYVIALGSVAGDLPAGKRHDSNGGTRMSHHNDMLQTNRRISMSSPVIRTDIQIAQVCSAAICEEIGDRLRINLAGEHDRLPHHMTMLVEELAQSDELSPLLVDESEAAVSHANLYRYH